MKELWEIYEIGDFVDAKDNQGDWRVGYIVEKNFVNRFFKVRFDGWSQKYDEYFKFTSLKLLDFRACVIGYTGQKKNPGIRNDWKFSLPEHQEKIIFLKKFMETI